MVNVVHSYFEQCQVSMFVTACVNLFFRYDIPQYGSRRKLITPVYDEYGEVIMEDDGYYYSPHGPEVLPFLIR